jgi:chorismate mutase/prephenate dehydratase
MSRPGHAGLWQYAFFIDIDGHVHEAAMERALGELGDFAQEVRVLGSYPVAIE